MTLTLFVIAIGLYGVGALASLVSPEPIASRVSGAIGTLAAVVGFAAALPVLLGGEPVTATMTGPFPFAHLVLRLDPLAALMVLTITLLGAAVSVYGAAYVEEEYEGRGVGVMGFLVNLFIASMLLVVVADNALWFIVFFEAMSLTSYFLVVFDQDEEAISAGWLYFLIAHAGTLLVLIGFLLLYAETGSLDFASFRGAALPAPLASVVFLLAFFGFGAKAGMVPLHVWLPRAHPAAPSHVSALLSGVMIKIGVFGIIKVSVDLLGATTVWWGVLVLVFGAVSAVLGVVYASLKTISNACLPIQRRECRHHPDRCRHRYGRHRRGQPALRPWARRRALSPAQPRRAQVAVVPWRRLGRQPYPFQGHGPYGRPSPRHAVDRPGIPDRGARDLRDTAAQWLRQRVVHLSVPVRGGARRFRDHEAACPAIGGHARHRQRPGGDGFVKAFGVTFSGEPRSGPAATATEVAGRWCREWVSWPLLHCVGFGAPAVAPLMRDVARSLTGHDIAIASRLTVFPGNTALGILSTPLMAVLLIGLAACRC